MTPLYHMIVYFVDKVSYTTYDYHYSAWKIGVAE